MDTGGYGKSIQYANFIRITAKYVVCSNSILIRRQTFFLYFHILLNTLSRCRAIVSKPSSAFYNCTLFYHHLFQSCKSLIFLYNWRLSSPPDQGLAPFCQVKMIYSLYHRPTCWSTKCYNQNPIINISTTSYKRCTFYPKNCHNRKRLNKDGLFFKC